MRPAKIGGSRVRRSRRLIERCRNISRYLIHRRLDWISGTGRLAGLSRDVPRGSRRPRTHDQRSGPAPRVIRIRLFPAPREKSLV